MFKPVSNPFDSAIYANGMIESDLPSGENINIFPQVSGPITKVFVQEGQEVSAGTPLFTIDDSVQRANTELAEANLKVARDQYDKRLAAYDADPKSVSKDVLDTAEDTVNQATAALKAADALLQYYSVKAPIDGVVLAVNATVGGYVSSQGDYDTYTELFDPLVIMSSPQAYMQVRCYVDEILVSRFRRIGIFRRRCKLPERISRCRWSLFGCSLTSRPRSSCPMKNKSRWTCACSR